MAESRTKPNLPQGTWRWAAIIFTAALLLRMIFLLQFSQTPLFDTPIMDMAYHHEWAQQIAAGDQFVDGPFFRAPLYPYLLGAVYAVFGDGPRMPRTLQILLGSFSTLLVFFIAVRVFNLKSGIIAGLMAAVSGSLIFYDGQLLIPTLAIWLDLSEIYLLLEARRRGRWWLYAASGLTIGLSAIARPTILLFAIVVLLWLTFKERRRLARPALFLGTIILPILPVTIHNYAVSGQFVPIATYAGLNFYIGNNMEADGVSARLPGARQDWWGMMEDAETLASREAGRSLNANEQSSFWLEKTVDEIIGHPGHFIGLLGRKCLLLISGEELSNNFDLYFFAHQTSILRLLMWRFLVYFPWGIVLPLACCGIAMTTRRTEGGWLLLMFVVSYGLSVVLFFVTARYRLPLLPILGVFAAYALVEARRRLQSRELAGMLLPGAVFLVALVLANVDFVGVSGSSNAQGLHALASIYDERGNTETAIRYYREALATDSTLSTAGNDLAVILMNRGELGEAGRLLARAVASAPENPVIRYNLASCYQRLGDGESARAQLRMLLARSPENTQALSSMAISFASVGMPDSARVYFRKLSEAEPEQASAIFNVGLTFAESGEADSAVSYYRRAIDVDSTFARARFNLGYLLLERADTVAALKQFQEFLRYWPSGDPQAEQIRALLEQLDTSDRSEAP